MPTVQKHPMELGPGAVITVHPETGQPGRWEVLAPPVMFGDIAEIEQRDEAGYRGRFNVNQHEVVIVDTTPRQDYIAGLRTLADLLEQHPEVPTPITGDARLTYSEIQLVGRDGTADRLAGLLGRPVHATVRGEKAWLVWHLAGLAVLVDAPVERIVTGLVRIGGEVREVVEYVLPDRYQPAPETEETTR